MKPFVTIELDKVRKLKYGINQLVLLEDLLKVPLAKLDMSSLSIANVRDIIFAGLSHEDKNLTQEQVGDLIDEHSSLEKVVEKITEAFEVSFGKK
jgi:hypothetical protein